eukprot:5276902-Ditylum_brightwellii.AAC.1
MGCIVFRPDYFTTIRRDKRHKNRKKKKDLTMCHVTVIYTGTSWSEIADITWTGATDRPAHVLPSCSW